MPHDLLHFLVEQEFGLRKAIFGQLAEGGTAGSFRAPIQENKAKAESRERRRIKHRGGKLLKQGIDERARSEHATFICIQDWYAHQEDPALRKKRRRI
jgi:hypothetical protein